MPNSIDVDLATTIVPKGHKIWKLFPGRDYKFSRQIVESGIGFLDVRGLDQIEGNPKNWDRDALLELISTDRWERQNANKSEKSERRISDGDKRTATFVEGLLTTAKKGDFVLVPGQGFGGVVSIFELTSGPGSISKFESQDGRYFGTYIGRRMKWIGSIPNHRLQLSVLERLQTPMAFFDMGDAGRTAIYEEVLGNYVYNGEFVATYRVGKQDYNSRDNRIASTWMEFVDLVSNKPALLKAIDGATDSTIYELLDAAELPEDQRSDLSININSPGEILMRALQHTPLIGLALFPLAASGVSYSEALEASVHLTTIGGAVDDCTATVQNEVRNILDAMGADRWLKACELAQRAKTGAELSTDSVVE